MGMFGKIKGIVKQAAAKRKASGAAPRSAKTKARGRSFIGRAVNKALARKKTRRTGGVKTAPKRKATTKGPTQTARLRKRGPAKGKPTRRKGGLGGRIRSMVKRSAKKATSKSPKGKGKFRRVVARTMGKVKSSYKSSKKSKGGFKKMKSRSRSYKT